MQFYNYRFRGAAFFGGGGLEMEGVVLAPSQACSVLEKQLERSSDL